MSMIFVLRICERDWILESLRRRVTLLAPKLTGIAPMRQPAKPQRTELEIKASDNLFRDLNCVMSFGEWQTSHLVPDIDRSTILQSIQENLPVALLGLPCNAVETPCSLPPK